MELQVTRIRNETPSIKAFELAAPDGSEPGTTILDALIDAGAFVSYECKRGECGTCQMHVLEGEPIHRDVSLTGRQRNEDKLMCTCVSWAHTERLVLEA